MKQEINISLEFGIVIDKVNLNEITYEFHLIPKLLGLIPQPTLLEMIQKTKLLPFISYDRAHCEI